MRKLNKKKLNKPRSKQAIASDLSKRAKKTLKNTKKNVKIWKKNPRRMDIEGVDTPKRKAKRTSKPKTIKTVRSKVVKKVKPAIKGKDISTKKVNSSIRQKKPKEKATMNDYEYKPYKAPGYAALDAPAGEFHHLLGELRRKHGNMEMMEKYEDLRDNEKADVRKKTPRVGGRGMSHLELNVKMAGWYRIINGSIKKKLMGK